MSMKEFACRAQARQGLHQTQTGAALLISLLILLVLSLVGLAAMRGGLLQNLMSANTTQDTMAFQAAESAIGAFLSLANNGPLPAFVNNEIMSVHRSYLPDGVRVSLENTANAVAWTRCVARDGSLGLAACGPLDGEANRAGQINAQVSVGYFPAGQPGVPKYLCGPGQDVTQNAAVGCHIFQIVGLASVGDATRTSESVTLGAHIGAP